MSNYFFKNLVSTSKSDYSNDEPQLIKDCSLNNRIAQEYLYKTYFDTLYHMCMRYCHDSNESLSIINDGMIKVFKTIHKYEAKGSFEGWIRKIVFNTLADHFRKENKRIKFLNTDDHQNIGTKPDQALDVEYIYLMIDKLPATTRAVFIKYAIEGFNHLEVSEQLGIAEGTSKWHLSRAREMLKEMLGINNQKINIGYQ